MEVTRKLLLELQNRLKVGNRRGVHLNAIPSRSRYKFDLTRLSNIDKQIPDNFIRSLLSEQPLKFKISWKDNVPDLNSLFEEDQAQLVKITKSFENLINQTEAIESEKGINTFGFGFPLLARRDQSDNKLTVAPILIWSLRIRRTKEFNTWEIFRSEDDPIYINEVLINHLQSDSKIEIDQISEELLDDGLIDKDELLDICEYLISTINSITPSDLRKSLEEKLRRIKPIPDKKHYENLPLNSNNSFIDFCGLFSIFEVQKQNIIQDYEDLIDLEGATIDLEDMDTHSFQPISSVETDPSQQNILHSLQSSRNILIQGPPGTGKSQSLTAILVNALENHKRTIVVCEKRTALEVLHNALCEKSLRYQCILIKDIIKDRRAVVDSVRDRVDNSSYRSYRYTHSKETLDEIIDKAKSLIDSINIKHKKLDEKIIGEKNWTRIVGELLSENKDNSEDFELNLDKESFTYESIELAEKLELIRNGHGYYKEFKPFIEISFLNPKKLIGNNPYIIEEQIVKDFSYYDKELNSIRFKILKFENEYQRTRNSQLKNQINALMLIVNTILQEISKHGSNEDFYNENKTNRFFYKVSSVFVYHKKETRLGQRQFNTLYSQLKKELANCNDINGNQLLATSIKDKVLALNNLEDSIKRIEHDFARTIKKEQKRLNLLEPIQENYQTSTSNEIKKRLSDLLDRIEHDSWSKKQLNSESDKSLIYDISELVRNKKIYFTNENDIFSTEFNWFVFYNAISPENRIIINELKKKNNWRKVFLLFYLNSALVRFANTNLPTDEKDHIELEKSLSGLEKEQIKYLKEYWFSKQIDATRYFDQKNPSLSVENLYNKRSSHKHKRLSLRRIVKYDMGLFTTFFPIILTTPDVCSNLFKDKNQYFDIVMFDEASQLKLEDNLPALLKGKQIIIAGDEHQMPPSNYFNRIFDGTIDDEDDFDEEEIYVDRDDILLSCESLLDFGTELSFEKKYLDFHYRSRHPYLIDFSNYAFYNQRLKPMPNGVEYNPIKYIQVNGTYSDHTNELEAETVLSIIENNISRLPNGEYPTVGIATFNIAQRNLIKGKIIERRKFEKYYEFNEKILDLEENGLFVKNLENIQGDERDVIILSTTYGINKDGSFAQRFGPINHKKGYKLLNVIITRAKYKIYVCSSIPESAFLNYKEYLTVEGANNRRAVFFAYLSCTPRVSELDQETRLSVLNTLSDNSSKQTSFNSLSEDLESPFEEEVYQALVSNLDEDKITPQFQFAGFRIDLVYDPRLNGIPRIAIECDGAAYHSSQEAYLYDRHRQKILENHGFVFHRIWSTNWWRNPKRETMKLVKFIQSVENREPSSLEDKSITALAFTDDISVIESIQKHVTPSLHKYLKETIKAISVEEPEPDSLIGDVVKLYSKVRVKYLNNGNDITVCLTKKEVRSFQKANGIQNIYINSLLAVSLIGKMVGDTVKVGNLDNYVEILEILN